MRDSAPHWFPVVQGSGVQGNFNGQAVKKWSDYSEMERATIAKDNPDAFIDAAYTAGYAAGHFGVLGVHSSVMKRLAKLDLTEYIKD